MIMMIIGTVLKVLMELIELLACSLSHPLWALALVVKRDTLNRLLTSTIFKSHNAGIDIDIIRHSL